ncbi:hypothetical protein ElyMa_004676800 [Elysia marginata]|uniref:Uncharacterized protein n=1 Tax=Elysia marginata TaxID=1093978 RepID=A0AAV4I4K3_9GAST|nr:hypothetical protein ElyMa_004676800 [Elysia marginata]
MQALLTSQCGSTLSIVPSAVSDITSKLTGTFKYEHRNDVSLEDEHRHDEECHDRLESEFVYPLSRNLKYFNGMSLFRKEFLHFHLIFQTLPELWFHHIEVGPSDLLRSGPLRSIASPLCAHIYISPDTLRASLNINLLMNSFLTYGTQ